MLGKIITCEISLCRSLKAFSGFSTPSLNSSMSEHPKVKSARMNITCSTQVFSFGRAMKQVVAGPRHGPASQI